MQLTIAIITAGTRAPAARAAAWLPHLQAACDKYQINTRARIAAFLATIGVESAALSAVVENLNYSAPGLLATWPSRFTAATAAAAARKPEVIANIVYACRMGNGAPASDDGWRFRGRGLIQITGKDGYAAAGQALGLSLIAHPELLEQPVNAAMSAAWWWDKNGCNQLADAGDMTAVTKRVNGGANGLTQRKALYAAALRAITA
ncbi:glycoside hydrolase family 19 protein [Chromobacterium violaceum]|uniref:glycoside hydrolase family 19 protein n=1 Tax=Chromobacterium violaceum TaxID=536 RepID=UPI001E46B5ED|nr:glycoside hydrolase family 19 protein [Chromobacterium violaceum]MCD0493899.1 glycoside hydrolase family 19 protein [Chromobacterium violaceum]